ncbi:MAG: cytochrome c family protein [Myxococcota bacterium]
MKHGAAQRLSCALAFTATLALGATLGDARATPSAGGALVSPRIYPPQRLQLRMNHALAEHAELACSRCHVDAPGSARSADRLLPPEASCAPCHAEDLDRDGAAADCGLCHVGTPRGERTIVRSEIPASRLRFSHAAHLETPADAATERRACLGCHPGVDGAAMATRAHLPTMESCFRCHGGDGVGRHTEGAPGACATCHLTGADGRLVQTFPEGTLVPPDWLHGMGHDRDFLVRHRWVAADQGERCAACHAERDCRDCHDGRVRPARVHRGDFLRAHAETARRNEGRCAGCHTVQRFCTECHGRLGIATVTAPAAAAGPWHPPGYAGPAHGVDARRSLSTCASCHAENDCVACHGAGSVGGLGLSPHPPGFAARCGAARRQNERACRTCHGAALEGLCP